MITSLGILERDPSDAFDGALRPFRPDPTIQDRLSYLNIPILSPEPGEEPSSDEEIKPDDTILFAPNNTDDNSSLSFYIHCSDGTFTPVSSSNPFFSSTSLFLHHDFYVFSTVTDAVALPGGRVAVATYEPDIFVYDCRTRFPVLPQRLLGGHTEPVMALCRVENRLVSAGMDGRVMEWDLGRLGEGGSVLEGQAREKGAGVVVRMDMAGKDAVYAGERVVRINGETVALEAAVERVRLWGGKAYVGDEEGRLLVYDLRNVAEPLFSRKVHDGPLYDLACCGVGAPRVATAGKDAWVRVWDAVCMEETVARQAPAPVYSLCYDAVGTLFCGDDEGGVLEVRV